MAIIYSYPEIGTIAAGDLMPITDVSDSQFPTKSVTLSKLTAYFQSQQPASILNISSTTGTAGSVSLPTETLKFEGGLLINAAIDPDGGQTVKFDLDALPNPGANPNVAFAGDLLVAQDQSGRLQFQTVAVGTLVYANLGTAKQLAMAPINLTGVAGGYLELKGGGGTTADPLRIDTLVTGVDGGEVRVTFDLVTPDAMVGKLGTFVNPSSITVGKGGIIDDIVAGTTSLSQYNLPYWDGSSFTDSIIKVQPNQSLPTIEVGETGDSSTKMKIFGGLEIEPAQPDFTNDKQFIIKADNSGGSQQPKISVPSNFDRVGINTLNPNAALVVGPGDQTDGKLLGIVKQTGVDYAYTYFSDAIGTGNNVKNGIVYRSDIVGTAPEQKGDRICLFTQSPTDGTPAFEQGKKANAFGGAFPFNYIALAGIEEFEQGNIPGPGFNSYSYIPQDGLYVDQGVVKLKRNGMETQTSVILSSPNGTKYKITVDDTGTLITTAV